MPPRVGSWRDVQLPLARPLPPYRGAAFTPGGLGAWRSVVPVRGSGGSSGPGGGRGQANELERLIAEGALEKNDDGINVFNAGGRALMGVLDALDTPRAVVASALNQAVTANLNDDETGFGQFFDDARRNITMGEVLGLDEAAEDRSGIAKIAAAGVGFGADVAVDPLTYVTGGAAKVGTEAGNTAARQFLKPAVKDFLGEAAVKAAEESGQRFGSAAARRAAVAQQGETLAARAAQKAAVFRSNQALSPIEREAIGATAGTYAKLPRPIAAAVEKLAPGRVVEGRRGNRVFRLTRREIGAGRVAGGLRAKATQNRFGDYMAERFTKFPELRKQLLYGSPEDSVVALHALTEAPASNLQRRLFNTVWGKRAEDLLKRAKNAGVDGSDLRYAAAEAPEVGGPSTARVMAQAAARGDATLVDDTRAFFNDIENAANSIDPELPWLAHRDNYTTRTPSDEMIALRGGFPGAGGAFRKETFDFRRKYGPVGQKGHDGRPYEINTLFGQELVDPVADKAHRSVDQQIDDILADAGVPNWFEADMFKSLPDYVARMSRRFGDEWLAKRLRDLGIADTAMIRRLTESGMRQGKINAAVFKLFTRAQQRSNRAHKAKEAAEATANEGVKGVRTARGLVTQAQKGRKEVVAERETLQSMVDALDPEALRQHSIEIADEAATIAVKRQALLDSIDEVSDQVFVLEHAQVEMGHRIALETHSAYQTVTRLESALSEKYKELGDLHDRLRLLSGAVDYSDARRHLDELVVRTEERANKIIEAPSRFQRGAFDKTADDLARYQAMQKDPALFKAWVDKQGNLGKYKPADVKIAADMEKVLQQTERQIQDVMGEIQSAEAILHQFEDVAAMPTAHLDKQLASTERKLAREQAKYNKLVEEARAPQQSMTPRTPSNPDGRYGVRTDDSAKVQWRGNNAAEAHDRARELSHKANAGEAQVFDYDSPRRFDTKYEDGFTTAGLPSPLEGVGAGPEIPAALTDKITALSDVRASILHEQGVIERARGRIAELDRTAPNLMATLDSLHDTEAMADKMIHSIFPDLPEEVKGSRLRAYTQDRLDDLQREVDGTQGQLLSAYADRDTMRVELNDITQNLREARRNLKKVTKDIKPRERELWAQEEALLTKADAAMSRAIEIDDEIEDAAQQIGLLDDAEQSALMAEAMAERYLSVMHARQMKYEADVVAKEAAASEAKRTAKVWHDIAAGQFSQPQETALFFALRDNFHQLGAVSQTQHGWMVESLKAATIMQAPGALRAPLRTYDRVLNLWKAYALSTPGTVMRNLYGGVFNNWLSTMGVGFSDYRTVMGWMRNGGKNLPPAERAFMQQIEDAGLLVGSGTTLEIERRIGPGSFNPVSQDFVPLRFFRNRQEDVESLVRGALAYRTLKQGGDISEAIQNVVKYHFDYEDLSRMERSVLRRVVPFYTWTRKNLPLMLEQIVQNPTRFTRYYQLRNEIELHSPEEAIVPAYFGENMGIRLPFSMGGGQNYALPDLPFTALNDVSDPSLLGAQVTPFVKTPIEYMFGKQVFKGIPLRDEFTPVPKALTIVPGAMPLLEAMGHAERTPEGQWMMTQKDLYVLESWLPVFGRARRLFPSEEKFDNRLLTSWASLGFGMGLRTNTPQEQRNAAFQRVDAALGRYDRYDQLGYFPEGTKMPRFGQTVNAAYEQLGIEEAQ